MICLTPKPSQSFPDYKAKENVFVFTKKSFLRKKEVWSIEQK